MFTSTFHCLNSKPSKPEISVKISATLFFFIFTFQFRLHRFFIFIFSLFDPFHLYLFFFLSSLFLLITPFLFLLILFICLFSCHAHRILASLNHNQLLCRPSHRIRRSVPQKARSTRSSLAKCCPQRHLKRENIY